MEREREREKEKEMETEMETEREGEGARGREGEGQRDRGMYPQPRAEQHADDLGSKSFGRDAKTGPPQEVLQACAPPPQKGEAVLHDDKYTWLDPRKRCNQRTRFEALLTDTPLTGTHKCGNR